jgi:uncharacterized DUF497 family protein
MVILVPEPKRLANFARHKIDLSDFEHGFSWDRYLAGPAKPSRTGRARERYIGVMAGTVVVAIISPLGTEALTVISIRPANPNERKAHAEA